MKVLNSTGTGTNGSGLKLLVFQAFNQLSPQVIAACAGEDFEDTGEDRKINVLGRTYRVSSPTQLIDLAKVLAPITDCPNKHLLETKGAVPILAPRGVDGDEQEPWDLYVLPKTFLSSVSTQRNYPLYFRKLRADINRGFVTFTNSDKKQAQRYLEWLRPYLAKSTNGEREDSSPKTRDESINRYPKTDDHCDSKKHHLEAPATLENYLSDESGNTSPNPEIPVSDRASISPGFPTRANGAGVGSENLNSWPSLDSNKSGIPSCTLKKTQSLDNRGQSPLSHQSMQRESGSSVHFPILPEQHEDFLRKYHGGDTTYAFDQLDDDTVMKCHYLDHLNAWYKKMPGASGSGSLLHDDVNVGNKSKDTMANRVRKLSYLRTLASGQIQCDNKNDETLLRRLKAQRKEWCETISSLINTPPEFASLEEHMHESILNGQGANLVSEIEENREFYLNFLGKLHQILGNRGTKNSQCLIGRYYRLENALKNFGDFKSFATKFFPENSKMSYTERDYVRDLVTYINDDRLSKVLSSSSIKSYIKN